MKLHTLIVILCLPQAGTGCLSAGSLQKVKTDKYEVRESVSVQLLAKTRLWEEGKVAFKCRISKYGDHYRMLVKVLRNDSALHVVNPGVSFRLADGDSVTLKPRRGAACCSEWADGRWYNASFSLEASDVEKLKGNGITSLSIRIPDGVVECAVASGKEDAVAKLLRSVDGE